MTTSEKSNSGNGPPEPSIYTFLNATHYEFDPPILRKLLAMWVQDPTFLSRYRRFCKASFFSQGDLQILADQILRHFDRNTAPPDKAMLVQRLKIQAKQTKKALDLEELGKQIKAIYSADIAGSIETLTSWFLEFGKIEQTKIKVKQMLESLKEGGYSDIKETVTQLMEYYDDAEDNDDDGGFLEESLDKDLARRKIRSKERIPTGIADLDDAMEGGFALGKFYLIAGGTGVGKSTAVMNILRGAVHANHPGVFISTELERESLIDKYHASITGIPMGLEMVDREEELKEKVREYFKTRSRLIRIKYFEPYTATVSRIQGYLKGIARRYNFHPKVVVIDMPDLLLAEGRHQRPHEALGEIFIRLFGMAIKHHIALVVTTDVKQGSAENLLVDVSDIGGAYEKGKRADGVICIGRDKSVPLDEDGCFMVCVNIAKLRTDGPSGVVFEARVNPKTSRWVGTNTASYKEIRAKIEESSRGNKKSGGRGQEPNEYRS